MSSIKTDLFQSRGQTQQPLAERMRPDALDHVAGQTHLLRPESPLYQALSDGALHSFLLWGPPGCGKTTLARLAAARADAEFFAISAVLSGVKEIRAAVEHAQQVSHTGRRMVLFVDEVHRFNKSQQDAFLPHIENGTIVFVGATTENPAFSLNDALLSRLRVYVLKPLDRDAMLQMIDRAIQNSTQAVSFDQALRETLCNAADGDGRRLLNWLELAMDLGRSSEGVVIDATVLEQAIGSSLRRFDKGGDFFYDQISALHKSIRGSDPDASLYWFCRMLDGGADPQYLARRLVRMASEDIGNADPRALEVALNAAASFERLGSPEGELALAQAVIYLAVAAKSNAVYSAYNQMRAYVASRGSDEVPLHLRNAVSGLAKQQGHGAEYDYPHDHPFGYSPNVQYLPDRLTDIPSYTPTDRGLEKQIRSRLNFLKSLDDQ
ncbi:MAG: replication-associated recombination protein A [Gammaproteobacteria bacterium]|nr:replication-associated recombination protein A [Gammaproteobacteria bacterium]